MDEEQLTPEEAEELEDIISRGYPKEEEKQNMFAFFKRVMMTKDNTKSANLTEEELGGLSYPVRTSQWLKLYCTEMGNKGFASFFDKESQIALGTSLSKEGFLDKLAVTQKRESEIKTKAQRKANKGWFKKKQRYGEEEPIY